MSSGLLGIFITEGFLNGWLDSMIEGAINKNVGHIAIFSEDYFENPNVEKHFVLDEKLKGKLDTLPNLKAWTPRIKVNGLISNAEHSSMLNVIGTSPKDEANVSIIASRIRRGRWLNDEDTRGIVIGARLAEKFYPRYWEDSSNPKNKDPFARVIGKKLVIRSQQYDSDQVGSDLFRVVGIFNTGMEGFDESNAYIILPSAQKLVNLEGRITEVNIMVNKLDQVDGAAVYMTSWINRDSLITPLDIMNWKLTQLMTTVGIFNTKMEKSDLSNAHIILPSIQKLINPKEQLTEVNIMLNNIEQENQGVVYAANWIDPNKLDQITWEQQPPMTIVNLFHTGMEKFDKSNAYIIQPSAIKLVNLEQWIPEVNIIVNKIEQGDQGAVYMASWTYPLDIMTWKQQQPMTTKILELMDVFSIIFYLIFYIAMAFGIVNTLLMAVNERYREIGIMLAIGTRRWQIVVMVALESFFLAVVSVIFGDILGIAVVKYFEHNGLDLSSFAQGMELMGIDKILYPSVSFGAVVTMSISTFAIAVFFSLYPAVRASRFKPIEAIQKL